MIKISMLRSNRGDGNHEAEKRTMKEVDYVGLADALTRPRFHPTENNRLIIAEKPVPFVAPKLHYNDMLELGPFSAEVVLIEASAAVGKSTLARHLSASKLVPLLDLAVVPVSTGSLKALVSDLSGDGDPIAAFHAGQVPIVIDAIDEGRLLSGETGFEYFLQTAGEFLLHNRSVTLTNPLILNNSKMPEFWSPAPDDVANRAGQKRACASRSIGWNWFMIF